VALKFVVQRLNVRLGLGQTLMQLLNLCRTACLMLLNLRSGASQVSLKALQA
jgi:hypothetical protein